MAQLASDLRDPNGGCPWDQKLNLKKMAEHLIEEAYEVAECLRSGDSVALADELGDLQFHIAMISQLASEQNLFDWSKITEGSVNKLVERHPHVYGEAQANSSAEVEGSWENRKAKKQLAENSSLLNGIAQGFPALQKAFKLGKKAAAVGFDWGNDQAGFADLQEKAREEWDELDVEIKHQNKEGQQEELGDYLFVLAQYARKLKINPEEALTMACEKFIRRFQHMETTLQEQLAAGNFPNLDEWESAWQKAKQAQQSEG